MTSRMRATLLIGLAALAVAGCNRNPLLVKRSPCPAVAIPHHVGTLTRFDPQSSRNAADIDISAQIIDAKANCTEGSEFFVSDVRYTVTAQRRDRGPAREVHLPLFVSLVQGGNVLVSKQDVGIVLRFAEGSHRAEAEGVATAEVHRSAATLPAELQERISRPRKPDDPDALIDPLSDPQVRAAVRAASFEVLVGFQLDDASLAYNIGR